MKRTFLSSLVLGPALLLGALLLPATAAAVGPITPSSACTAVGTAVTCNLWAKVQTGGPALPGTTVTKWWGFSDSATGIPTLPGPVLVVNQGDTVTVNLTNNLAVTTSILFDGQPVIPDTTGVGAGGTKSYAFNASAPGTYLYEAGLIPGTQYQVAMGLYGVLVVRPSGAPGQAYGASTAFDDEALVVLGEIDPVLNGSANPVAFDLRNFAPKFQLINGQAYSSAAPSIATTGGNKLLLRYANAGIGHSPSSPPMAARSSIPATWPPRRSRQARRPTSWSQCRRPPPCPPSTRCMTPRCFSTTTAASPSAACSPSSTRPPAGPRRVTPSGRSRAA